MTGILGHLLVATDGSDTGDRAVSFATALALRHGSVLHLCHSVDRAGTLAATFSGGYDSGFSIVQALDDAARSILVEAANRATDAGLEVTTAVLDGEPAHAIVTFAKESKADAIVVGTRGKRGAKRFFMGSTADGVLRGAEIPTFVVPPGSHDVGRPFGRILIAVDDSDPSDAALAFALDVAGLERSELVLVRVLETRQLLDVDPTSLLTEIRTTGSTFLATRTARAYEKNVAFESLVLEGDPAEEILKTSQERHADLVVVGTHGRHGLQRLFVGSVAGSVVSRSALPVLVVRASASHASHMSKPALATFGI